MNKFQLILWIFVAILTAASAICGSRAMAKKAAQMEAEDEANQRSLEDYQNRTPTVADMYDARLAGGRRSRHE